MQSAEPSAHCVEGQHAPDKLLSTAQATPVLNGREPLQEGALVSRPLACTRRTEPSEDSGGAGERGLVRRDVLS